MMDFRTIIKCFFITFFILMMIYMVGLALLDAQVSLKLSMIDLFAAFLNIISAYLIVRSLPEEKKS